MSVSEIITTLGNEGQSAAGIAEELLKRGFRDRNRLPFTPHTVQSFMRLWGIGPTVAPQIVATAEKTPIEQTVVAISEPLVKKIAARAQREESPRIDTHRPSRHPDYSLENLNIRD